MIPDWRPGTIQAGNRRPAVFLRPHQAPLWSGLGEGALALAGFLYRRYANLALCPATPIGVGGVGFINPIQEASTVHHVSAYPEQSQSPVPSHTIDTLRAAKFAAQERLDDARRKLSSAQSEFQKASKAERAAVLALIEACDNAMEAHHG
ncbi:hypothetical protein R69927_03268 [Paraburkholderia domus]|uniref:Uncharacterized protein n=1 Tax=Paraburkholderia domus TaxID=2793075 RepID=A0A9N8MUD8_9BURK|nr:hypothetical protein R75483_00853 [Paraburkholderia domus]CAE6743872.1 hypothetical protein R69749_00007 [Paraburkholderia domus]CAE6784309.1 hypothetical protein R70006_04556 [Paraburkholderia domus]CAE6866067.1 hypothetical protein R75471_00542 [Paraburkholderia domus]CAE6869792.1 hypothetical protein R69927_03268 [Paraburkholderia domus]